MNRITVVGFVGKDAESRNGKSAPFTTFSVADNSTWNDKATGEKRTHTEWFNCVANGEIGKESSDLKKGDHVEVIGEIRSREYKNQSGIEVRSFDVRVLDVKLLPKTNGA